MMWAQNWPEPTSASPQLASALSLEAGWTWATWQAGRPFDCRRPWRVTLAVRRSSWGGRPPFVGAVGRAVETGERGGGGAGGGGGGHLAVRSVPERALFARH